MGGGSEGAKFGISALPWWAANRSARRGELFCSLIDLAGPCCDQKSLHGPMSVHLKVIMGLRAIL